jgi:hypothetical protein
MTERSTHHRIPAAAFAAALLLPLAAAAQQQPIGAAGADRPAADPTVLQTMPEVAEQNGIRYLSGGVGADERDAMRAAARDFNLRLSFAERTTGQLVALVDVAMLDAQGREVLRIPDAGPILLVALPPGDYRIRANYEGREQTRQVRVGERSTTREYLTWQDPGRSPAS